MYFFVNQVLVYGSVFCQPSGSRRGSGRDYWGGSVTVISIRLCVLSAMWKQEGGQGGNNGVGV